MTGVLGLRRLQSCPYASPGDMQLKLLAMVSVEPLLAAAQALVKVGHRTYMSSLACPSQGVAVNSIRRKDIVSLICIRGPSEEIILSREKVNPFACKDER